MGYFETDGLILYRRNLFEEDQELTLLTPGKGGMKVRVPHARKSQKTYCGRLEPLNLVSARLYRAREDSWWVMSEVEISQTHASLLHDEDLRMELWPLLSLFRDLFPEGQPPGPAYVRFQKALQLLDREFKPAILVVARLLARTAAETGIDLPVEHCQSCGTIEAARWLVSPQVGLLCGDCGTGEEPLYPITDVVRRWYLRLKTEDWASLCRDSVEIDPLEQVERLIYRMFHFHFEISLNALKVRQSL